MYEIHKTSNESLKDGENGEPLSLVPSRVRYKHVNPKPPSPQPFLVPFVLHLSLSTTLIGVRTELGLSGDTIS